MPIIPWCSLNVRMPRNLPCLLRGRGDIKFFAYSQADCHPGGLHTGGLFRGLPNAYPSGSLKSFRGGGGHDMSISKWSGGCREGHNIDSTLYYNDL